MGKTSTVLVSCNVDGSLSHWHASSGKLIHQLKDKEANYLCMDFNAEGRVLATGSVDCQVTSFTASPRLTPSRLGFMMRRPRPS